MRLSVTSLYMVAYGVTYCFASNIRTSTPVFVSPDEYGNDRCTAIAVGRAATADGSTMTTYNADCAECDWRVNKVEAQDWPEGSMRPIYLLTGAYPKQVRTDRGYTWTPENLEDMPQKPEWEKMRGEIIGHIPQVKHTYALLEGLYGIMNEHQVAIGESTCASKLFAAPRGPTGKGKALLEAAELSQIALERGKTAREAIQVMGDLSVKYGFYSAEWDPKPHGAALPMGEGGEALTVVDPLEAWMFHIIPDNTGASAVWVAQRVPDDHIAVVANMFVIREVIKGSPDFMYSDNLWSVAEHMGWWSPRTGTPLNFLKTYAPQRYHPSYVNLRIWRVFTLASPGCGVPPESTPYGDDYPFSMKVPDSKLLTVQDMIKMQSDHYEGTHYSTAEGIAGGPYGDPNRFDVAGNGNMTARDALEGEFPRAISLFRTSQSYIAQARKAVPSVLAMVWFGQYAPDVSTYVPLYVAAKSLPKSWISGAMHKYNSGSAWWNFAAAGNYAARFYSFSMAPEGLVRRLQRDLDGKISKGVKDIEKEVMTILNIAAGKDIKKTKEVNEMKEITEIKEMNVINFIEVTKEISEVTINERESTGRESTGIRESTGNNQNSESLSPKYPESVTHPDTHLPGVPDEIPGEMYIVIRGILTLFTITQGDEVSLAWKDLLPNLITTYRDGMVISDTDKAVFTLQKMFYPRWWLQAVGYFNSKGNGAGILFAPNPRSSSSFSSFFSSSENFMYILVISVILSLFFGYSLGHSVGGKTYFSLFSLFSRERRGYVPLGTVGQYQISPNFPDSVVDSRCCSSSEKILYMTTGRSPQSDLNSNT